MTKSRTWRAAQVIVIAVGTQAEIVLKTHPRQQASTRSMKKKKKQQKTILKSNIVQKSVMVTETK